MRFDQSTDIEFRCGTIHRVSLDVRMYQQMGGLHAAAAEIAQTSTSKIPPYWEPGLEQTTWIGQQWPQYALEAELQPE